MQTLYLILSVLCLALALVTLLLLDKVRRVWEEVEFQWVRGRSLDELDKFMITSVYLNQTALVRLVVWLQYLNQKRLSTKRRQKRRAGSAAVKHNFDYVEDSVRIAAKFAIVNQLLPEIEELKKILVTCFGSKGRRAVFCFEEALIELGDGQGIASDDELTLFAERYSGKKERVAALLDVLLHFAFSDDLYSTREQDFIEKVRQACNVTFGELEKITRKVNTKRLHQGKERVQWERLQRERANTKGAGSSEDESELIDYARAVHLLRCRPGDDYEKLKRSYRALCKEYHPDQALDLPESEVNRRAQQFMEVQAAFEIIEKHLRGG